MKCESKWCRVEQTKWFSYIFFSNLTLLMQTSKCFVHRFKIQDFIGITNTDVSFTKRTHKSWHLYKKITRISKWTSICMKTLCFLLSFDVLLKHLFQYKLATLNNDLWRTVEVYNIFKLLNTIKIREMRWTRFNFVNKRLRCLLYKKEFQNKVLNGLRLSGTQRAGRCNCFVSIEWKFS